MTFEGPGKAEVDAASMAQVLLPVLFTIIVVIVVLGIGLVHPQAVVRPPEPNPLLLSVDLYPVHESRDQLLFVFHLRLGPLPPEADREFPEELSVGGRPGRITGANPVFVRSAFGFPSSGIRSRRPRK